MPATTCAWPRTRASARATIRRRCRRRNCCAIPAVRPPQIHYRLAPPLLALAFALLAVPLARSPPRQPRYGRILMGFLAYLVGMNLMILGTDWLGSGKLPMTAGLWWLVLPLLAAALWMYL